MKLLLLSKTNAQKILIALFFVGLNFNSVAQLLQWNTFGNAGTETTEASVFNNVNIAASNLTHGTITGAANGNRLGGTNWWNTGNSPGGNTLAEAIAGNDYMQFIVTPNAGFNFTPTSFVFQWESSGTGPNTVTLRSSYDAFAANLGTVTVTTAIATHTITISGLTGLTAATTFRLYGYGASATTGTGGFDVSTNVVNVQLNGTTAANVPLLTVSPSSLTGFTYLVGTGPSASQSYNLSGTFLTGAPGNITVTESTDYEVSADNITFGASASIPYASATLAATPVYVRLKAGRAIGTYNGQTISNAGGGATTVNVTCDGNVTATSLASDIISFGGESATISSTINTPSLLTSATGVQVWQFKVRDGGATLNDADAFATTLTDFTISQAAGNAVSNWATAIRTIELFDGTTNVTVGTITTGPNQISFTGLSLSVADNTEKIYSLRLSLNCGIGSTNFDGDDFGFQISNGNVTFLASGSGKFAFPAASSTNGLNVISVVATQLSFIQQPVSTGVSQVMAPSVTVKATDACGNTDLSFVGNISITSTGTLTGSPVTVAAVAGVATYTSLTHTVVGTGYTLTATAVGLTSSVSAIFDITVATIFGVGDMAIVGMCVNMNGCSGSTTVSEDEISFVSFEDITPGTAIDITDNGFERLNCGSNTWGNTEGVIRITRNTSTLPKGTIITLRMIDQTIFSPVQPDANWTVSYPNSGYGTFNMNATDEQIYIMQGGTWNKNTSAGHNATYTGGLLMFAINTYSAWSCNNNLTTRGDLPPSLKCFSILPGIATNHIKYTGPTTAATQKDWVDRLNSASNWTGFSTCAAYLAAGLDYEAPQTYVINAGGFSSGYWTGSFNTDWYDCNNWQNYKVPDSLSNVTIDNVTNDPIVGASPALFPNGAICNDLLITSTSGTGILTLNNALSRISIKGNITNNGTFISSNGLTDFRSANAQTISGTGTTTFYNLRLNNSNASGITLFKPVTTSATLTFLNGILTTTSTNILNMSAGSVASGVSNISFVNGPVNKTGSTNFIFPVGKDNVYRPISVTALTGSETFTAEYFHADPDLVPYNVTIKDASLDDIGRCEYWILNRAGAVNANVTLSWDTYSCGVTSLPDLAVARWDGTMWKDHGNGGTTGTTANGTIISSAVVTSFSPFTLASILAGVNPLPIELLSFTANYNSNNKVDLKWSTASETNNDHFTIERSEDGIEFYPINVIDGAGNSTSTLNYSSVDEQPLTGISYYRLKQTDYDGNYSYSSIVSVEKSQTGFAIVNVQHSTSQNELAVYFNCDNNCNISIELYDLTGKKIYSSLENALGKNSEILIPTSQLSEGIYLLKAFNGEKVISNKVKL